jgi:hypothetical protein
VHALAWQPSSTQKDEPLYSGNFVLVMRARSNEGFGSLIKPRGRLGSLLFPLFDSLLSVQAQTTKLAFVPNDDKKGLLALTLPRRHSPTGQNGAFSFPTCYFSLLPQNFSLLLRFSSLLVAFFNKLG